MFEYPAVFVDIETNGGNGVHGRITEIAMIRVEDGEITETYQTLINPGVPVPPWITRLTGITNEMLQDAPYFDEVAADIYRLLEGAIFVAHNVRFDYSFVKRQLEALGYTFTPRLFCTVRLSRALYSGANGHSLEKIILRHNIKTDERHRAMADVRATYDFAVIALAEHGKEAFEEQVAVQLRSQSLPPNISKATVDALPRSAGVYVFEDADGTALYVGKSINIQARVRSHFTNDTRQAREMKLAQASHAVSYIQTDTEIEALLLESAKVKELQPVYNRLLRRRTKQTVLIKNYDERGYLMISMESRDLNETTDLESVYGVYTSRQKAKTRLENLLNTFQLCPRLLGLETGTGRCFRSQLGLCKGACAAIESAEMYNRRVELALQHSKIEAWPFSGELAVAISPTKALVIDQWIIKGYVTTLEDGTISLERLVNGFDVDTYKILRRYLRTVDRQPSVFDARIGIPLLNPRTSVA